LRAVADLDNYKKRTRREIEDAVFRARQDLLSSFFPTADNLDRALELARGNEQLFKGIEMVSREFRGALSKFGIEAVPGVGHTVRPGDPRGAAAGRLAGSRAGRGDPRVREGLSPGRSPAATGPRHHRRAGLDRRGQPRKRR
jgi:hypothetical protein